MTERSEHDPWAPVGDVEAPVAAPVTDPESDKGSTSPNPSTEDGKGPESEPSTQDGNRPAKSGQDDEPQDTIAAQLAELDAARKGK